jgi:hypothetical protein
MGNRHCCGAPFKVRNNHSLELLDLKLPIQKLPITNYQLPTRDVLHITEKGYTSVLPG